MEETKICESNILQPFYLNRNSLVVVKVKGQVVSVNVGWEASTQ